MDQKPNASPPGIENRRGEIEITWIFLLLWKRRKFIVACTLAITLIGMLRAILSSPEYYSEAVFTLKGTGKENSVSNIFSQFGGIASLGGGGVGNTTIGKIEIILKGHELAEDVVADHNLLPLLFPKEWDSVSGAWKTKDPKKIPTLRNGGKALRGSVKIELEEKKALVRLGIYHKDPQLAKKFVEYYVTGLNNRMRENIVADAEVNRAFLEAQMSRTSDPVLIGQLNALVVEEVQKMMFASSNSLEILEHAEVPLVRSRPNRKLMVLIAFITGVFLSTTCVLAWQGFKKLRVTFSDLLQTQTP